MILFKSSFKMLQLHAYFRFCCLLLLSLAFSSAKPGICSGRCLLEDNWVTAICCDDFAIVVRISENNLGGNGCCGNPIRTGLGVGFLSLLLLSVCCWLHKLYRTRANKLTVDQTHATALIFHVLQITPLKNLRIRMMMMMMMIIIPMSAASSPTPSQHNFPIAKAQINCVRHCGNISIPFPFGTTSDCHQSPTFLVTCNQTAFNPPKLFLQNSSIEITDIFIDGQIRILHFVARDCYGRSGTSISSSQTWISLPQPFTINSTANKFTIVGCDAYGYASGTRLRGNYSTSCSATCDGTLEDDYEDIASCRGLGCCMTSIPAGATEMDIELYSYENYSRIWNFSNCGYAFMVEESRFYFSRESLSNLKNVRKLPMLVNWVIGNETCDEARRNSSAYACKSRNSMCYDPKNSDGYRCICENGYEGNPYTDDGCRDIDECQMYLNPCQPNSICMNRDGGYECHCRKGYHGNGGKDGFGCSRVPLSKRIIISIGVGVGIGSLLVLSLCFWLHKLIRRRANKKKREKFFKRNGGLLLQQQKKKIESTLEKPKLFPAKDLEKATDNFNESRVLGQGGQGTVYKGMLSDGQIVAIKKSKKVDEDQLEQFINEVAILSQINHRNVVKILGCCLETEVPLLVYEFVPNGTLFDLIHDPNSGFLLSWNMRLKIAADIAGALAYLHSACSLPIYHRDIKTSNILLDEKYVVKVSDFGTSKSVTIDQTHVTTLVKGTFGYLDPEYFRSGQFTEKSDVYSFAVVLVELLTGQRVVSSSEEIGLAARFLESMEMDGLDEILDDQVSEEGKKEEVVAVARLAQSCLNLHGKMRPSMKEVAIELETVRMSQMPATLSVEDGIQQVGVTEEEMMMLSDFEFSWTTSGKSVASSSSDCHPLMFETV